ncbi:aldo/keto reductase [Amylostereum chailletii]|nr:aldo/keto reductase [Amylostereum chailletii]
MVRVATLGGTAQDVVVRKTGLGTMMMTWKPNPVSDEDAFGAIKAGIDALPPGAKMYLNCGQFYAQDASAANLELVARFFDKHPECADRVFLSVKGGCKPNTMVFDVSPEGLRKSVDFILEKLRGTKRLDLFQIARVDRSYPLVQQMKVLSDLVAEGKFDHVGLSEACAATVREANAVVPIAAVEIEVSLWSWTQETRDVIATCKELDIAVIAYAPLGRGILTGKLSVDDLQEGDFRRRYSRFQDENFKHNIGNLKALNRISDRKGVTLAQMVLAWVNARGQHVIPIPGSSSAEHTRENVVGGDIFMSANIEAQIEEVFAFETMQGSRGVHGMSDADQKFWG